MAPMKLIINDD